MTTAGSGGGGVDHYEYSSCSSPGYSPKHRLKFLCSYGGKILPRPTDGLLKYVGGDTRVIVVRRSISFAEFKEKILGVFRRCSVIKYQLVSGDLDVLVTVTCDEDLVHMIDEYDRLDALHPRSPSAASSSPRFRLFLFPITSSASASLSDHPTITLDQRFLDAINTVVPGSPRRPPIFTTSAASSTVSSPSASMDGPGALVPLRPNVILSGVAGSGGSGCGGGGGGGGGVGMQRVKSTPDMDAAMHRVHSTPNLGGGLLSPTGNGGAGPQHHHNVIPPHLHSQQHQYSPQNVYNRQVPMGLTAHGAQAAGGGGGSGAWRTAAPALPPPRHEAYGCRIPQSQMAQRGGLQYYGGGGGSVGGVGFGGGVSITYGNPEESNSTRTSRGSPPFRTMAREPVMWE